MMDAEERNLAGNGDDDDSDKSDSDLVDDAAKSASTPRHQCTN